MTKLPANSSKVNYMGPENSPFKCSNCKYFDKNNSPCGKVSDPIQSEGCCDLFEKRVRRTLLSTKEY